VLRDGGCAALIPQALAQPGMPRLRVLKLSLEKGGGPRAATFTPLWAAPWFSQLQELSLTGPGFGGPGLAPLRAAPLLRKLYFGTSYRAPALTAADGRALAVAALPELRELQLYNLGPGLVAALAAAPWLCQLTRLDLWGRREGPARGLAAADGRALAAAPLPSLKRLGIRFVEPGFMAACAAAAWLERLESLDVGYWGGGVGGMPGGSLAWAARTFTALTSLTLNYGDPAPPSEASRLAALVAAPWFGRLHHLALGGFPLGTAGGSDGAGLRALAAAPLPNLTSLSLSDSGLLAADVSGVLSSAPWLAALTSLELSYNHLGAPGHRALSRLRLPHLRTLSLDSTGFSCACLAALASAPWLTQLTKLNVEETGIASRQSLDEILDAIEDDAWVFGALRRAGCIVDVHIYDDDDDDDLSSGSSDG
jgi:hypothetical protein